jgi:hypothetical protein
LCRTFIKLFIKREKEEGCQQGESQEKNENEIKTTTKPNKIKSGTKPKQKARQKKK